MSEGDVSEGAEFPEPPEEAKLFVGNLAYDVDSQALAMLFEQAGTVEIAEVNSAAFFLRSYGRHDVFMFIIHCLRSYLFCALQICNKHS